MNGQSDAAAQSLIESQATRSADPTRPFYWSVWRELRENRSIYIAPLIVAAIEVFGFAISAIGLAERRRAVFLLDPLRQRASVEPPYDIAAIMIAALCLPARAEVTELVIRPSLPP